MEAWVEVLGQEVEGQVNGRVAGWLAGCEGGQIGIQVDGQERGRTGEQMGTWKKVVEELVGRYMDEGGRVEG